MDPQLTGPGRAIDPIDGGQSPQASIPLDGRRACEAPASRHTLAADLRGERS